MKRPSLVFVRRVGFASARLSGRSKTQLSTLEEARERTRVRVRVREREREREGEGERERENESEREDGGALFSLFFSFFGRHVKKRRATRIDLLTLMFSATKASV